MPRNKRESLIFTILMCFFMVYCMSVYNIALHMGELSWKVIEEAWLGLPIAFTVAFLCDWFIVSGPAKKVAFMIASHDSSMLKKVIAVSTCMVCCMVVIMSLYGAIEAVGLSRMTFMVWLTNIPKNFIVALPLQLVIAGPVVRFVFRSAFPEGTILA